MMTQLTKMLDIGTQTIPMRDIAEVHCRCGRGLTWKISDSDSPEITSEAECHCGMIYIAGSATIKIEGIDRETQTF